MVSGMEKHYKYEVMCGIFFLDIYIRTCPILKVKVKVMHFSTAHISQLVTARASITIAIK